MRAITKPLPQRLPKHLRTRRWWRRSLSACHAL
jgi:hypothetical protein